MQVHGDPGTKVPERTTAINQRAASPTEVQAAAGTRGQEAVGSAAAVRLGRWASGGDAGRGCGDTEKAAVMKQVDGPPSAKPRGS